ncbi:MAG: hemolysin III family protein [Planctomycetota bacterium]
MNTRTQSVGEELANAITHGAGALLSIAGLVLLIVRAAATDDPWRVVSFTIFGAALVLLYLGSTLYHSLAHTRARALFKALDHSLIYVLIAGTYTPFMLGPLRGPWGWSVFGAMWGMALIGILFKARYSHRFRRASTILYLGMGWVGLIAIKPLLQHVPPPALAWLLAGGLAYSLGTLFYVWRGQRYHHAAWHLFVLAGSACHFVAIYGYLA